MDNRETLENDGNVFVLEDIPENYIEDLIINYVECYLNVDVKEVKIYPFIPGRALVFLQKKLEDFSNAERTIAKAKLESKNVQLLPTVKKTAIIVTNLEIKKLSLEFLCHYFECEFADGSNVIEDSKAWPQFNIAIVYFYQHQQAVVEKILKNSDHVALPSENYHITVQPFYENFHEYVGQQKQDGIMIEAAVTKWEPHKIKINECDEKEHKDNKAIEKEVEEDSGKEENIGDKGKVIKCKNNYESDQTVICDKSSSEEKGAKPKSFSYHDLKIDKKRDSKLEVQKDSTNLRPSSTIQQYSQTSLTKHHITEEGGSSYLTNQRKLFGQDINGSVSQSFPEQDSAFKRTQQEYKEHIQNELNAKDEKIKQLEKELKSVTEKSKHCVEKIKMVAWKKEFLIHSFGSFDGCTIKFDPYEECAILEGKTESVKELQLNLLKELKSLKEQILALTPAMHYTLSKDKGKHFLANLNSSTELNGAKIILQGQSLLVTAKDDVVLNFALDFLKSQINYKETINSISLLPKDKLIYLKSTLESQYLVKVDWSDSGTNICVEGTKDEVSEAGRKVTELIEEFAVHEKSFAVGGLLAKLFHRHFQDKIRQILQDVEIIDFTQTDAILSIQFKGDNLRVNIAQRKLNELKAKVAQKSWDLRLEFNTPEDLMLVTKGFSSEKMTKKINSFETRNKCIIISKLPHLNSFTFKVLNKAQQIQSTFPKFHASKSKHQVQHKTVLPSQTENKLKFEITDTCQLIIKSYGDITKENSDILVCVVAQNVDMEKTKVGQTFSKLCPKLQKLLQAEHTSHPNNAVLVTKGQLYPLKCQAICHVILSPWNPNSSQTQLSNAILSALSIADDFSAKSISFPVLGCGRAFRFPPSEVAQIICSSLKAPNVGRSLQKVTFLSPDIELFKYFKSESPKYFMGYPFKTQGAKSKKPPDNINDEVDMYKEDEDIDNDDSEYNEITIGLPPDLHNIKEAELSIIALLDKDLQNLWTELKKEIANVCLYTDYFNQELVNTWPKTSRERIVKEAKKLTVWVKISPNPKTKKPGYIIKGEKKNVQKVLKIIHDEFHDFSSYVPKHRIISDKTPKRGTFEFLKYASESDEQCPSYWKLNSSPNIFKELLNKIKKVNPNRKLVDVDLKTRDAIIKLVADTWDQQLVGHGMDAIGLSHRGIKVTDVKRIENLQLFEPYNTHRKRIFKRMCDARHICPDIGKIHGSKRRITTTACLEDFMKKELYYEINEHYLFHGTKFPQAIIANGIDPKVSSESGMFGKGIYTAERFTKSDQYTDPKESRSLPGTTLVMFLVRVLLGNVFVCDDKHKSIQGKQKLTRPPCKHCYEDRCNCSNQTLFDSVMGDGKWHFREFVVYEQHLCYPEYLIYYQRV